MKGNTRSAGVGLERSSHVTTILPRFPLASSRMEGPYGVSKASRIWSSDKGDASCPPSSPPPRPSLREAEPQQVIAKMLIHSHPHLGHPPSLININWRSTLDKALCYVIPPFYHMKLVGVTRVHIIPYRAGWRGIISFWRLQGYLKKRAMHLLKLTKVKNSIRCRAEYTHLTRQARRCMK